MSSRRTPTRRAGSVAVATAGGIGYLVFDPSTDPDDDRQLLLRRPEVLLRVRLRDRSLLRRLLLRLSG